jgi:hypothetical protein
MPEAEGGGGGFHPTPPRAGQGRFRTKLTAYKPETNELEGGRLDRGDRPVRTLQEFLAGQAKYVSVAGDPREFGYGTELRIQKLEESYNNGKPIPFVVVDTGDAFHKGRRRLDIAVTPRYVAQRKGGRRIDLNEVDPRVNDRVDVIIEHLVPPNSQDASRRRLPDAFK